MALVGRKVKGCFKGERSLGCGSHMEEWGGRPAAGNSWGVLGRRNGTEQSAVSGDAFTPVVVPF